MFLKDKLKEVSKSKNSSKSEMSYSGETGKDAVKYFDKTLKVAHSHSEAMTWKAYSYI